MEMQELLQECKRILSQAYGGQFQALVLFGSSARGQSSPESDIDLLVLLRPPFDYLAELRRIVDLLYPVQLQSERLISARPVPATDFERGRLQLYRNAQREGVRI